MEIQFCLVFQVREWNRKKVSPTMCDIEFKQESLTMKSNNHGQCESEAYVEGTFSETAKILLETGGQYSDQSLVEIACEYLEEELSYWSEGFYQYAKRDFDDAKAEVVSLAPSCNEVRHFLNYLDKHGKHWDGDLHGVEKLGVEKGELGSIDECYFFDIEECE